MKKVLAIGLVLVATNAFAGLLRSDDNNTIVQGFAPSGTTSTTATKHTVTTTGLIAVQHQCTAATNIRINVTTGAQYPLAASTPETLVVGRGVTFFQYSSASGTTCYIRTQ